MGLKLQTTDTGVLRMSGMDDSDAPASPRIEPAAGVHIVRFLPLKPIYPGLQLLDVLLLGVNALLLEVTPRRFS